MNQLSAGFGRVNVTPMLGIGIAGYYKPRFADGVLDDLEINALALSCGAERAVLLSMDHCGIGKTLLDRYRNHIAEVTGLPYEAIFIHATHTHTGPFLNESKEDPLVAEYAQTVYHKMADAARFALEDLKPAKLGWAVGRAPNIAFIRRYRMKDGGIRTNPGVDNPDILEPIGTVDERVNVLRFDQEGGKSLVLVNFGDHPDTVGGCKISADWPGFLRRTVEQSLDNTRCIFFNGAQGDVNHVNVHPTGGDLNDMFMDFDDVSRGYGHARHMGRVVAGAVLEVFDKVQYADVDSLRFAQKTISVPSNRPKPEELDEARRISALHNAGKDAEIPFQGMELTTVVAEAERMLHLEHGPDSFPMYLSAIAIGPVALLGIPGEPFTGIGRALKKAAGWELVLPCCNTNGKEGYFPMREAYDEGGYEARSSNFRAGVAELIIEEGTALLAQL